MKQELTAQLEKFKVLTGRYPARVDGHQHVHVFPGIRDVFAEVSCVVKQCSFVYRG